MQRLLRVRQTLTDQAKVGRRQAATKHRRALGQALVELALILPVLLLLSTAALDLGRLYYGQITINNAAKEGALEAASEKTITFDSTRTCDPDTNRVMCP